MEFVGGGEGGRSGEQWCWKGKEGEDLGRGGLASWVFPSTVNIIIVFDLRGGSHDILLAEDSHFCLKPQRWNYHLK